MMDKDQGGSSGGNEGRMDLWSIFKAQPVEFPDSLDAGERELVLQRWLQDTAS